MYKKKISKPGMFMLGTWVHVLGQLSQRQAVSHQETHKRTLASLLIGA